MRKLIIALALTVAPLTAALAQSGSTYDWQSGNSYRWNKTPGGDTSLHGYNYGTGSSWDTTISPNGNQRGYDSQGNYWNYNAGTGSYYNSNGTTCYGKGAARTCY